VYTTGSFLFINFRAFRHVPSRAKQHEITGVFTFFSRERLFIAFVDTIVGVIISIAFLDFVLVLFDLRTRSSSGVDTTGKFSFSKLPAVVFFLVTGREAGKVLGAPATTNASHRSPSLAPFLLAATGSDKNILLPSSIMRSFSDNSTLSFFFASSSSSPSTANARRRKIGLLFFRTMRIARRRRRRRR
jgi:hypothetical protein